MKKLVLTEIWMVFFSSICAMDTHSFNTAQKPSDSSQEVQTIRVLEDNVPKVIENPKITSERVDEITFRMQTADINPIKQSSENILLLDISKRREEIIRLYNKFLHYFELFDRAGLDAKEILDDFKKIKIYVDEINITTPDITPPKARPFPIGRYTPIKARGVFIKLFDFDYGLDTNFNYIRRYHDLELRINSKLIPWLNEVGIGFSCPPVIYVSKFPDQLEWDLRSAIDAASAVYNHRLDIYKKRLTESKAQIEHAEAIVFPSESFDRLVDQVNSFLAKCF